MKAILILDMPKSCAECSLRLWDSLSEYYGACVPTLHEENCIADSYKINEDRGTVPSWCPLKPLPEPKYAKATDDDVAWGEAIGWNACLDYIIGETE